MKGPADDLTNATTRPSHGFEERTFLDLENSSIIFKGQRVTLLNEGHKQLFIHSTNI